MQTTTNELKQCTRCHSTILLKYFETNRKGELYKSCNNCRKNDKRYKDGHKEQTQEYRDSMKEQRIEYDKKYRQDNKDYINQRQKEYIANKKNERTNEI